MQRSLVARAAGTLVLVLLGLGGLAAGCAPGADGSAGESGRSGRSGAESASTTAMPPGSLLERPPLPPGFPVLPGAQPAPLPDDDPGLIAAWTLDQPGMAAYDFYVAALPAAGYRIEGLYPGGEWAIIRFRSADGVVWQLLVHATGAGWVEVEVRLDRP